jgi:nucleoside 2-deoxyribosyltransferase
MTLTGKKIYLAANFAARDALQSVKTLLEQMGAVVTSRWIDSAAFVPAVDALMDIQDISAADMLLLFVDQYGPTSGRGKYFEFGYAYALGKQCILIGEANNCVFFALPNVPQYKDAGAFISEYLPVSA